LQGKGILIKKPHPLDKRKEIYELTEDGLDLIPALLELATWGTKHVVQESLPHGWLKAAMARREEITPYIRETVSQGGSVFVGNNSVVKRLGL
jgi:DNA-binding MarR family transcriptional regulator